MLFFKRYLEKSQVTLDQFESSHIPCYIKMRELPAPKKIDFVDDLVWLCSVRFSQYTEDWIVDEYFVDHDDDYLLPSKHTKRVSRRTLVATVKRTASFNSIVKCLIVQII
ncbi:hypothetical protein GQX74_006441 [Glossina fuscipes]|nr:hypothetical protein GQX74_006441 [Glossina fuscipes]